MLTNYKTQFFFGVLCVCIGLSFFGEGNIWVIILNVALISMGLFDMFYAAVQHFKRNPVRGYVRYCSTRKAIDQLLEPGNYLVLGISHHHVMEWKFREFNPDHRTPITGNAKNHTSTPRGSDIWFKSIKELDQCRGLRLTKIFIVDNYELHFDMDKMKHIFKDIDYVTIIRD